MKPKHAKPTTDFGVSMTAFELLTTDLKALQERAIAEDRSVSSLLRIAVKRLLAKPTL